VTAYFAQKDLVLPSLSSQLRNIAVIGFQDPTTSDVPFFVGFSVAVPSLSLLVERRKRGLSRISDGRFYLSRILLNSARQRINAEERIAVCSGRYQQRITGAKSISA